MKGVLVFLIWVFTWGIGPAQSWEYECSVFQPRTPRCRLVLDLRLRGVMVSGNWTDDGHWDEHYDKSPQLIRKRSLLSACLRGKTLFFAGSSFTRVMILGFLEELTGQTQDSNIGSRHPNRSCANMDGYDIESCGWPGSKWWILQPKGSGQHDIVQEAAYTTAPPAVFPRGPTDEQWMIVFQFKTFVRTPELDTEIIRQARGYRADLFILETGIWGFLHVLGSEEEQSQSLLHTIRQGYSVNNVIMVTDGFHRGVIGPHMVNGSVARDLLHNAARDAGFIRFDRTDLLFQASKQPALAASMSAHGYAGRVSNLHTLMLFSFMCRKH